ncbi:MAG TPA: hypothetical protein VFE25_00730 [Opitutaceae bacterium]|jgi:hypothetical protein|nr:hypothetical protein [Opitutaceae bacterium]
MTEREIPFSAPMRATLMDGTKTQTRRVLTEAGVRCDSVVDGRAFCIAASGARGELICPYGISGDHLRVTGQPGLLLQITEVRAERLDSISVGDALAEGAQPGSDPVAGYRAIWDGLNKARGFGWTTNPWVWVIIFVRLQ